MLRSLVCAWVVLLVPAALLAQESQPKPTRPPNVILIVADDFGWADLSCYGSKYHRSPHLDALAKQGTLFTDAYAACPVCSPTRAAIMTGKHPARLHLTDWLPGRQDRPDQRLNRPQIRQQLPLEETTLAEVLQAAGYKTAHVGKWHLGGEGFEPTRQGFDINIAGDHTGTPLSYFAPFRNKMRVMPGLEEAPEGEYLTDRLTTEAEKIIHSFKDKPFFLYFPHYTVHIPMRAKAEIIAKYPGKLTPGTQSNPIYAAMIESLDESVGRIRKTLAELGLAEDTIILFTSDNGGLATLEGPNTPATINAPLREGKGYLYEGGTRVPLIVHHPRIQSPAKSAVPVSSDDLLPTICELCQVPVPAGIDGVSFAPVLTGKPMPEREGLYWHYPHYSNQGGKPGSAVRAGRWKLIEFFETQRFELFDLEKDIRESRNLAAEHPDVVKQLSQQLAGWRERVGAQIMSPNPGYVPNPQMPNGNIPLPARTADIEGTQLRYEPLPHKNTLGFWTQVNDRAKWDFTVTKPGTFTVEVLQGCGTGQGGSEVAVLVGEQQLTFTVEDTGGFQKFRPREIGTVTLETPGLYSLTIQPMKKARAAVMDVRQVVLKPKSDR